MAPKDRQRHGNRAQDARAELHEPYSSTTHIAAEHALSIPRRFQLIVRLRGARCEFFFCGGGLPICEVGWPAVEKSKPCVSCGSYVAGMLDAAQFPRRSLDDLVSEDERQSIATEMQADGDARVSSHGEGLDPLVEQSLMWFFRTARLPDTKEVARARQDFRVGAAIMATAAPRLLEEVAPDVVVVLNGLFYEERIIREEAAIRGIRVVSHESGAQAGTVFFSAGRAAPDHDITDLWVQNEGRRLAPNAEGALDVALAARRRGDGVPHQYYRRRRGTGKTTDAPLVAVFTNVSWDTAVTGRTLGFESMFEWVGETVRIAQAHPELEFVIRAHPAESQVPGRESRDRVTDFVQRNFATPPGNLRLVAPEEELDSYALADAADIIAVYTSTIGLEAAAAGKAVCVAGGAHYAGRGFTTDVFSADQYRALFTDLTWAEPDAQRHARARLYAYLYFCRAMIPFPAVAESRPGKPAFAYRSIAELAPGRDQYLDLVCDGILGHSDIRLPEHARSA